MEQIRIKYSVALCTYNGEKYINEQLKSILQQSVLPEEIILSDDGSKDKTLLIAKKILLNSGIKYKIVYNNGKHGVTANFQNAINLCNEEIVFTSDQDDVWMKEKAECMLKKFEDERALLVFSDGELVDSELNPLGCTMWESVGINEEMINKNEWTKYLMKRCLVTGAAMAFKKSLLTEDEVIPESWLHDGWLGWKAAILEGLVPYKQKLIKYRQHNNNVVGMSKTTSFGRIKKYIMNFHSMAEDVDIRYNRYCDLRRQLESVLNNDQKAELEECISFWFDLKTVYSSEYKIEPLKIIHKNFKNGNYYKFYTGGRGVARDVINVMIRFKSKNIKNEVM